MTMLKRSIKIHDAAGFAGMRAAGYPPGAALANQLRTLRRAWLATLPL
ncbi:MAG: hypothetical protein ACK5WY_00250 [Holosporaceae bacterium]|jgi:hypothetical protein